MFLRRVILCFLLIVSSKVHTKPVKVLLIDSPKYIGGAGFFHNFHLVLGGAYLLQKDPQGMLEVDFGKEGLYYDPVLGDNWWSYYFNAPCRGTPEERSPLIKVLKDQEKGDLANFIEFYASRTMVNQLIRDHIEIKEDIVQEVEDFYSQHMRGFLVLGVHYRGTDKFFEADKVSYQTVIQMVDSLLLSRGIDRCKIFIATDDEAFLKEIRSYFGDDVIVALDAIRSKGNIGIHYMLYKDPYRIGREALIDCLLLSKCDLLIRTNSNLSTAAAYFNPDLEVISLNYPEKTLYEGLLKKGLLNDLNRRP